MEYKNGAMGLNMKVTGSKIKALVRVNFVMLQGIFTMENGSMIRQVVSALIITSMGLNMKENGKMISKLGLE